MTSRTLFDPKDLPEGVISPEKLDRVNDVVARLRLRLVPAIEVPPGRTAPSVAAMIGAHNQSYLRRCLHFAEAGAGAVHAGYGLASLAIARAILETVASHLDFLAGFEAVFHGGDVGRMHDFVHTAAFATAMNPPASGPEPGGMGSVRGQVERMNEVRPGIGEEYDRLCESLSPNVFWTWIYFAQHDRDAGRVRFLDLEQSDADYLQWMVASVQLLAEFEMALARSEALVSAFDQPAEA